MAFGARTPVTVTTTAASAATTATALTALIALAVALLALGTGPARIFAVTAMPASAAVAALGAFAAAGWLVLFAKETLQPAKEAAGLPGCFLFAFAAAVRGVFARLKTRLLAPRLARLEPTLVASRFPRAGIAAFPPVARLEGAPILATRGGALGFPANLRPAG